MKKVVIYRSNFGLPLSKWDRLMNWLWFYIAEKDKLWVKMIYYPLSWVERTYYKITGYGK